MSLQAKRGSFVANTSTGNQAITGVGFQGKLVILTCIARTAVGDGRADVKLSYGAASSADSNDQFALARYIQDAVASSNSGDRSDSKCIIIPLGNTTVDGEASFVSFDSDGFTINWTDAPASAYLVEYMVIGGTGISAKVLRFAMNTGGAGTNVPVTGVGFQPKALLVSTAASPNAMPQTSGLEMLFPFGIAISAANQVWFGATERDNQAAAAAGAGSRQTNLLGSPSSGTFGLVDWEIDLASFDSDGFTYHISNSTTSADVIFAIAIGGANLSVDLDEVIQPTSTGQQAVSTGFAPSALLGFGTDLTSFTTSNTIDGVLGVGMTDGSSESCLSFRDVDAADPMVVATGHNQTKFYRTLNSTPTVVAECDSSMGASGYTLDWTTVDATARQMFVLALGDSGAVASSTKLAMIV